MERKINTWASDNLLTRAKTDINAQYELALLAIKNRRMGYAVVLLKAAKKRGHIKANTLLITMLNNLQVLKGD